LHQSSATVARHSFATVRLRATLPRVQLGSFVTRFILVVHTVIAVQSRAIA
jgi:hypothetical protein